MKDKYRPLMDASASGSIAGHTTATTQLDYIAGEATMEQLRPGSAQQKQNAKELARGRIKRLQSGKGKPISGERIFVKRHVKYVNTYACSVIPVFQVVHTMHCVWIRVALIYPFGCLAAVAVQVRVWLLHQRRQPNVHPLGG